MSSPNLKRFLTGLRRHQWRHRSGRGHRSHPKTTHYEHPNRPGVIKYNFVSVLVGYNLGARIRKPRTVKVVCKKEEGVEQREGGFLAEARDTMLVLARLATVAWVITGLLAMYLITRLTHPSSFPTVLRKGIEFLGPIFVKFGQWVSTRRDIFPRDVCDALSQLQRNATPHPWSFTERLLVETYGSTWRKLFLRFDDAGPIGSGCCAQVYKAWVDSNATFTSNFQTSHFMENEIYDKIDDFAPAGPCARKLQAVAVKVLHPGIKGQLKRDIAVMRGLSKCATYLIPKLHWLSLTDCVDEFARLMENQVDMRLEASNLARFSANFLKRNDVTFPRPYAGLTHREILVESFHEGTPISDYLEHDDAALQRRLAKIGITAVLKMVFRDNFIHCDLHPGNILVEKAVVPKASLFNTFRRVITLDYVAHNPRLIILDCGLVVSLNDRCRQNLRDVFYSVLMRNGEMVAQHILDHSSYATPDPDGFKSSIKNIVETHLRNSFRNVNVSTVVSELFSAMVRHRVKHDGSFSNVILSVMVIEGLGRCLDPDVDMLAELLPYVLVNGVRGE
ncbi:hypothetical protein PUN28_012324 [Cardiocondyla obscurior]|uniref:Protein kinase domain-containing protein n=2 Tax=Cardiocondyla obscurior TaxID=286306 RepID=A0AAW2FE15_9HYME